ncbi:MAG: hypothetical protein ACOX20_03615 [Limnochordia bacterium]
MRTIKTENDIHALKKAAVLTPSLLDFLEVELQKLIEAFGDLEIERPLDLMEYGYIVLLEPGDNVRDLREVGLDWVDQGLLGSLPEFVERERLSDGTEIYRIGVLYDNDYMMIFLSLAGSHDAEVEAWLAEETQNFMRSRQ